VITIRVKVSPRSRSSSLEQTADGDWLARLKSPPVDGKANRELVALIAERFGCPKSAVSIKSGAGARLKLVRIDAEPPPAG
jgi:uncharacterized protein (TIGR00251 family)